MKQIIIMVLCIVYYTAGYAQQNNFVYIQADGKQTFYVKINGKLYSSSVTGYAIIPKLQKGDYQFEIGFPKNEYPVENIPVTVNGDAGYALKNFGSKGWGLFDMQTMTTLTAGNKNTNVAESNNDNGFINVLAEASGAPELKTPAKSTTAPATTSTTTAQVTKTKKPEPEVVKTPEEPIAIDASRNGITKISTKLEKAGRSATYISFENSKLDTIDIFIPYASNKKTEEIKAEAIAPAQKEVVLAEPVKQQAQTKPAKETTTAPVQNADSRFLDIEMQNPNTPASAQVNTNVSTPKPPTTLAPIVESSGIPSFNSDCKAIATNDDFLKIRKKMAGEADADGMLKEARKLFKNKCYSTEQIKNLSVLFLSERGKYDFFDEAYRYVHDPQQYPVLQSELTEDYYIKRFQALINHD